MVLINLLLNGLFLYSKFAYMISYIFNAYELSDKSDLRNSNFI